MHAETLHHVRKAVHSNLQLHLAIIHVTSLAFIFGFHHSLEASLRAD